VTVSTVVYVSLLTYRHAYLSLHAALPICRIDATGEVLVPHARIEPADLTTAVLSSSDEMLVGAEVVDPALRWNVYSNIRLVLGEDRKSTRLNSSHVKNSYAVYCLKKKTK